MVVRSVSGAGGAGVAAAAQRYILATGRGVASSDGIAVGAAPGSRSQQEQQLAGRTRLHISLVHSPSADTRVEISVRDNGAAQPEAAPAAAPPPRPQWNTLPRRSSTPAASTAPSQQRPETPPRMYGPPSWYKQNRELKRRSTAIMQKFIQVQPDGALLDLLADETDAAQAAKDGDELEDLRNTVKRLSGEVARLQSELNSARLQEFEAQEAAVTASAELDEARRAQEELAELRALRNNMTAAADLLRREVAALRDQCDLERQAARRMQSQADKAVKERNVLAHQSSLLAEALAQDDRLLPLLAEVESLKRLLEEERARVWELQEQQDGHQDQDEHQDELLTERLRIAEEQLSITAARAERSEREGQQLRDRLSELERELEERRTAPPPPPAAPPLPPPPPPPPLPNATPVTSSAASPVKLRSRGPVSGGGEVGSGTGASSSENQANNSAVQDMANLLGIPRKPQVPEAIPGGAIDNIINQIKGGRFTLKATEQNVQKEKKEEKPAAVAEMLNILGTLRRRPREPVINSPSPAAAPKDVAL